MMSCLANAFVEEGHEATATREALDGPQALRLCSEYGIDLLIQVNRLPPPDLPSHIRHVSWFQDVYPDSFAVIHQRMRRSDLLYVLTTKTGDVENLPGFAGTLYTGVNLENIGHSSPHQRHEVDFSLCGYVPCPISRIPAFLWWATSLGNLLLDCLPGSKDVHFPIPSPLRENLLKFVERHYRPLTGTLDSDAVGAELHRIAHLYRTTGGQRGSGRFVVAASWGRERRTHRLSVFIQHLAREYTRFLDRDLIVKMALQLSRSLELYGPGWETHRAFRPYARGFLPADEVLDVYRRTRINLSTNPHGFGMHSRTLDCMGTGGFLMMHESDNDDAPGGILTEFEPGVHFARYTPENFLEEARRWLRDEGERLEVGRRAAERVRTRHTWRHRAQQILRDLAR